MLAPIRLGQSLSALMLWYTPTVEMYANEGCRKEGQAPHAWEYKPN